MSRSPRLFIGIWRNSFIFLRNSTLYITNKSRRSSWKTPTIKLYWVGALLGHRTVPFNRPDITLVENTINQAASIDIAIPLTHNLHAKNIQNEGNIRIRVWNQATGALNNITVTLKVSSATGSSVTRLIKASPPSIYHHAYCPRSRKKLY